MSVSKPDLSRLHGIAWEKGSHQPDHTMCIMEAVAYVNGETWSDHPACADPGITKACIYAWDGSDDATRKKMVELIPEIVGTSSIPPKKLRYFWADKAVRVFAPAALEKAGLKEEAEKLRALPKIDSPSAESAARSAARSAAWSAAESAARSAESAAWSAASARRGARRGARR